MADVYRKGTKSVHVGWVRAPGVKVAQVDECNLDPGGKWGHTQPVGSPCTACFGPDLVHGGTDHRRRSGRSKAATAGTAAALALAAAVFASSLGEPVNYFGSYATASGAVTSTPFATVTPGPLGGSPGPTVVPALTPAPPIFSPPPNSPSTSATPQPLPTFGPPPTWPPIPTWPPFPALPTLAPLPSVRVCVHPGTHLGVDACQWPHQ